MIFHGTNKMTSVLGTGVYANVTSFGCYAVKTTKKPLTGTDGGIIDVSYLREWSSLSCLSGLPGIVNSIAYSHTQHSILLDKYTTDADNVSPDDAMNITTDIILGLDSLARRGILHRDIKPSNVLVRGNRAVLCDFGLSRYMQAETCEMTSNVYSDWWRPPELLLEPSVCTSYDYSADIWGAGMTILDICLSSSIYKSNMHANILQVLEGITPVSVYGSRTWNRFEHQIQEARKKYDNNLCIPSITSLEERGIIEPSISDILHRTFQWDPEKRAKPNELLSMLSIVADDDYLGSRKEYMLKYDKSTPRVPIDLEARNKEVSRILDICAMSMDMTEISIYMMDTCLLRGLSASKELTEVCIWLVTRLMNIAPLCYCPESIDLVCKVLNTLGTLYSVVPSMLGCSRGKLIFGYYLQNTI